MFIAPAKRARRRSFTLLEITLAVAILAMMSVAIYRFVLSNLTAVRISTEENMIDARYDGLRAFLTAQWQSLPGGNGALTG
ncbi:MAG: prepilin-type N-terminal cleavage/methylation domain-containing protein, partial [Verrucomicrobiota bacterium]|nr:prepilin-type N-terminal cleavage/methylation domain-containing protein [Verrucomicrobiota bacterium]